MLLEAKCNRLGDTDRLLDGHGDTGFTRIGQGRIGPEFNAKILRLGLRIDPIASGSVLQFQPGSFRKPEREADILLYISGKVFECLVFQIKNKGFLGNLRRLQLIITVRTIYADFALPGAESCVRLQLENDSVVPIVAIPAQRRSFRRLQEIRNLIFTNFPITVTGNIEHNAAFGEIVGVSRNIFETLRADEVGKTSLDNSPLILSLLRNLVIISLCLLKVFGTDDPEYTAISLVVVLLVGCRGGEINLVAFVAERTALYRVAAIGLQAQGNPVGTSGRHLPIPGQGTGVNGEQPPIPGYQFAGSEGGRKVFHIEAHASHRLLFCHGHSELELRLCKIKTLAQDGGDILPEKQRTEHHRSLTGAERVFQVQVLLLEAELYGNTPRSIFPANGIIHPFGDVFDFPICTQCASGLEINRVLFVLTRPVRVIVFKVKFKVL